MALKSSPITADEPNNVLQSFDDSVAGRSMLLYYACATTTSSATSHVLARDAGRSDPTTLTASATTDFDVSINKTTVFSGIGYVDFHFTASVGDGTTHAHMRLYHYDGATETAISADAVTVNIGAGTGAYFKLPLTITTKRFKPGDTLRLKVTITFGVGSAGTLYHDPSTAGDELKLWVPVRVYD